MDTQPMPPPHEQRVLDEKIELDLKAGKLKEFIAGQVFPTLPRADRWLLVAQRYLMRGYSMVLRMRIKRFGSD